jgi:hypothetical protein
MKKILYSVILILVLTIFSRGQQYKLYFLGGQSNMDGFGLISDLPSSLNKVMEGVMIFHGNPGADNSDIDGRGIWSELRPGHGAGFKSDGKENVFSNKFGPELSFAKRLSELEPGNNIAIIKYSKSGSSIDPDAAGSAGCWEPDFEKGNGVNQYDHFLAAVKNALSAKDINGDEKQDRLIPAGIIWMQGESDAVYTKEIAERYETNLKKLIGSIRRVFDVDDLPVVIGLITDSGQDPKGKVWEHLDVVRKAQHSFVKNDVNADLVTSTKNYKYSDPWHYDSKAYIDLGKNFAESIYRLQKKK